MGAGVFASFTPLFGFHFLLAFTIAYFVAGNFLAAALGTFFGNPLTFPFIWAGTHKLGTFILRGERQPMPAGLAMFSPWLDLALTGYSLLSSGLSGISPFTMEMTALCARLYLQDKVLAIDPDASPLFGDLSGLPPSVLWFAPDVRLQR